MGIAEKTFTETLPADFLARMKKLLGDEYEDFLAAYERQERAPIGSVEADSGENPSKLSSKGSGENVPGSITEDTEDALLGEPSAAPPRFTALRVNPREEDPAAFEQEDLFHLEPVPWESCGFYYHPELGDRPGRHPYHQAGVYYMQEPSAMAVVALSGIRPGERVLDLCAAPGGKSTQAAAWLRGQDWLLSNEIHPGRAKILSQNIERLGITNAVVTNETPERLAARFPSYFDTVIVDAPCSGEGMFRKEETAIREWNPENVRRCAERQQEILEQAAAMTGEGGTLMYSTCTFAPQEDEETIALFLKNHPEFTIEDLPAMIGPEKMAEYGFDTGHPEWIELQSDIPESIRTSLSKAIRIWPHRTKGEGHFIARLRKAGKGRLPERTADGRTDGEEWTDESVGERRSHEPENAALNESRPDRRNRSKSGFKNSLKKSSKNSLKNGPKSRFRGSKGSKEKGGETADSSAWKLWEIFAQETLSENTRQFVEKAFREGRVTTFGSQLYLLPEAVNLNGLHVLRPGLHLGTVKKERLEPAHALAMALRPDNVLRTMDISQDSPEALRWLCGETLECSGPKGWTLVCVDGHSMGWGKTGGGKIKNHYPKGLRIQK